MRTAIFMVVLVAAVAAGCSSAPTGRSVIDAPAPPTARTNADLEAMQLIRRSLAAGECSKAERQATAWIGRAKKDNPYYPEAMLLRGNAKLAADDEFESLFDYEEIVKNYPASEQFVPALERELDVARLYLGGRRRPSFLGIRIDSGIPTAEEIIIRINERLPGSRLAETALLELADYYYRDRDLRSAADAYDVFVQKFPKSEHRDLAMQRRAFATIAQFKGPGYDTTSLTDARYMVAEFQSEYPGRAQQAGMTDSLLARLDESVAASKLKVAKWYIRRGDPVGAKLTLQRLIKEHSRTGAAELAQKMLDENGMAPTESTLAGREPAP